MMLRKSCNFLLYQYECFEMGAVSNYSLKWHNDKVFIHSDTLLRRLLTYAVTDFRLNAAFCKDISVVRKRVAVSYPKETRT